jgi:hypothetical protein
MKRRFKAARLLQAQLASGFEFVTNFNESISASVIPGRAKREPKRGASSDNNFRLRRLDRARRNADGVGSSR